MATLEMTFTKGALDKAAHTGGAASRFRDARYRGSYAQAFTQTDPADWAKISTECYVTRIEMEHVIQTRAVDRPAGYKMPTKAEGRRMFLWSAGCSMQARGWDDAEIATELRALNTRLVDEQHPLFEAGGIDDKRLSDLIKEILKLEKGTSQDLTYDVVARFNERWAMMMVNGKVEFLNRAEGVCYLKTPGDARDAWQVIGICLTDGRDLPDWVKRYLLRVSAKVAQIDGLAAVPFEFYPASMDIQTRPEKAYYDSLTVFSVIAGWRRKANNAGEKLSLEECFLRYIRERLRHRGNVETIKTAYYRGKAIAEDEIGLSQALAKRGVSAPCTDQR